MTPAGAILKAEIESAGPVRFSRFMDVALYHPRGGYYRGSRDPFGKGGDFYTAEQVQPVFGLLIRRLTGQLRAEGQVAGPWSVVELGAGRGEMAEFFGEYDYRAVEAGDETPEGVRGLVFANEFFDALPVDVFVRRDDCFRQKRVGCQGEDFVWVEGEAAAGEYLDYLARYAANVPVGGTVEVNLPALEWANRIRSLLGDGYVFIIDYGYTTKELLRFPEGTLMSYRKHLASEDVLATPGERDLSAHVCFSALRERFAGHGFEELRWETLGRALLRIGEEDEFACLFESQDEAEKSRRRQQLKTLLFGMGETFRTLLLRRPAGC